MTTHHPSTKLPPRHRCMQCGGVLRASEWWYCWLCRLLEKTYPTDRRN